MVPGDVLHWRHKLVGHSPLFLIYLFGRVIYVFSTDLHVITLQSLTDLVTTYQWLNTTLVKDMGRAEIFELKRDNL